MKIDKIKYIERKTGELKIEKVPGENALKFLYNNPFGKLLLFGLVKRKIVSEIYGRKMNEPSSKKKIIPFIEEMEIKMEDYKKNVDEFKNFNEFFYRELKEGARKVDYTEDTLVSPADGKILAFEDIKEKDKFFVKGSEFTLREFFSDDELSQKYEGGTFVIIRLAPVDYHRFHFPASGKISETKKIEGDYYSVSPYAIIRNFRIFCENKREYSILQTQKFGDVALFEIGATMVGGIEQTYKPDTYVEKGDEKGYFYFGGSTCIMVFEKDKIKIDSDILENTRKGIETKVYMGEKIANEKK